MESNGRTARDNAVCGTGRHSDTDRDRDSRQPVGRSAARTNASQHFAHTQQQQPHYSTDTRRGEHISTHAHTHIHAHTRAVLDQGRSLC